MDFNLSKEQMSIKQLAKQFADAEMLPFASEWDKKHIFPIDTLKKAAALGFAAIYIKEDVGGSALSRIDAALIFEELATACPSTAAYLSIHNMVSWLVDHYATEALRQHYLPQLTKMSLLGSYCLTEPHAGSDAQALTTFAKKTVDHYVVTGTKVFISGGSISDLYACMVKTEDTGISCLLVEKNTPGLSFGIPENKLGWHSQPTTSVFFDHCKIPRENLLGKEGEGFKIAMSALNSGRINIAACSLGGAKQCLHLARDYLLTRQQFQQKLADFEALQFRFADMLTHLEAAKWMIYHAAFALDTSHPDAPLYAAMAKRYATDVSFKICDEALQLLGGYGYIEEYQIERYFRDLRVHQILEGTNEIMRLIIAKRALKETFAFF